MSCNGISEGSEDACSSVQLNLFCGRHRGEQPVEEVPNAVDVQDVHDIVRKKPKVYSTRPDQRAMDATHKGCATSEGMNTLT